jgi:hypothetical protein
VSGPWRNGWTWKSPEKKDLDCKRVSRRRGGVLNRTIIWDEYCCCQVENWTEREEQRVGGRRNMATGSLAESKSKPAALKSKAAAPGFGRFLEYRPSKNRRNSSVLTCWFFLLPTLWYSALPQWDSLRRVPRKYGSRLGGLYGHWKQQNRTQ